MTVRKIPQSQIQGQETLFDIPCVTQEEKMVARIPQVYLDVCTKSATLVANSIFCPETCGGHPTCKPCYDLGRSRGLVR